MGHRPTTGYCTEHYFSFGLPVHMIKVIDSPLHYLGLHSKNWNVPLDYLGFTHIYGISTSFTLPLDHTLTLPDLYYLEFTHKCAAFNIKVGLHIKCWKRPLHYPRFSHENIKP